MKFFVLNMLRESLASLFRDEYDGDSCLFRVAQYFGVFSFYTDTQCRERVSYLSTPTGLDTDCVANKILLEYIDCNVFDYIGIVTINTSSSNHIPIYFFFSQFFCSRHQKRENIPTKFIQTIHNRDKNKVRTTSTKDNSMAAYRAY